MRAAASRLLAAVSLLAVLAGPAGAADPSFPPRDEGRHVFDRAEVLDPAAARSFELRAERLLRSTGVDLVVLVRVHPETDTFEAATAEAEALIAAWSIGRTEATDALVVLVDLDESRCHGQFQFYADEDVRARFTDDERQRAFEEVIVSRLEACDLTGAVDAAIEAAEADLLAGAPDYSDAPTVPGTFPADFSLPPGFGEDSPRFADEPGAGFPSGALAAIVAVGVVIAGVLAAIGATKGQGPGGVGSVGQTGHAHERDPFGPVGPIGGADSPSSGGSGDSSPGGSDGGAGGRF